MEKTCEQLKAERKGIKRHMSGSGWALIIYAFILNTMVLIFSGVEIAAKVLRGEISFDDSTAVTEALLNSNAWGYIIAIAIGFLILLLWKKPRYLKEEIFAKSAPMKPGVFFMILCVFISGQMVVQIETNLLEMILNAFGYTIVEGLESFRSDPSNISMVLYAGILGPVAEEILFRGLLQRSMLPYGKKFAILISSLIFGVFHANIVQIPYAFAIGLVLGYVAAEYNIIWAIVLHIINNFVLGDLIYRLLSVFPRNTADMIVLAIIIAFTVAAVIIIFLKRKEAAAWLKKETINREYLRCYFTCAGTVLLLIMYAINTILNSSGLITAL